MGCRAVDLRTGPSKGLLAPLLHILLHELLGVLLQHLVDLVQERVELLLELLALLGDLSRRLDVGLVSLVLLAVSASLLLGAAAVLCHRRLLTLARRLCHADWTGWPGRLRLWTTACCSSPPLQPWRLRIRSSAVGLPSRIAAVCIAVPLVGSSIGTRCRVSRPMSKMIASQPAAAICGAYLARQRPRKYARVSSGGSVTARVISLSATSRSTRPAAAS